jgi:hypothetical protein
MSDITKPAASKATAEALGVTNVSNAMERRRLLLKVLGKGSAVLAATIPITTLAQSTTLLTPLGKDGALAGLRCSVSGMQSGVHSRETGAAVTCGGYSPGWWGQVADSKAEGANRTPRRTWPIPYTELCTNRFTKTATDDSGVVFTGKTLFNVMDDSNFANTKTRHWIGAFLNASGGYPSFPYTAQQILDCYNRVAGAPNRDAMYVLIITYLETHS